MLTPPSQASQPEREYFVRLALIKVLSPLRQADAEIPREKRSASPWLGSGPAKPGHFTSTVAPASVNFFLMVSASSLETPSLMFLGAPSTSSLASFKPRLVTSRTALITLILFAPTSLRTTVNSVFSSAGAAAAAAPPPPATITGAAAAADTPKRDSSFFTSSAASRSDSPTIDSSNCARSAILILRYLVSSLFRHPPATVSSATGPIF